MITIAVVNNKGGVSKTSSTANIGAYLAYTDKKTLLVDTDPQSNLTQHFNFYEVERSLYNAYLDFKELDIDTKAPILKINDNLYILPASRELSKTERELVTYNNNQQVLKKILKPFQKYFDFCLIDCPPSLGLLTDNAIVSSESVIIPIEASQFSLNGVGGIVDYLKRLKHHNDLDFEISGVFMAKFDERKSISFAVQDEIKKYFKDKMFKTFIRTNTDIEKAQANGQDVFMFAKNSHSALDYANLTEEILKRVESKITVS